MKNLLREDVAKLDYELVDYVDYTKKNRRNDSAWYVGGYKTFRFSDIAGYEAESVFWSDSKSDEKDYAYALVGLINSLDVNEEEDSKEYARVLSEQILASSVRIAKSYKKRSQRATRRYWLKWGLSWYKTVLDTIGVDGMSETIKLLDELA